MDIKTTDTAVQNWPRKIHRVTQSAPTLIYLDLARLAARIDRAHHHCNNDLANCQICGRSLEVEKGTGPNRAKHPKSRWGDWDLSPFSTVSANTQEWNRLDSADDRLPLAKSMR